MVSTLAKAATPKEPGYTPATPSPPVALSEKGYQLPHSPN
jgi:hypothetical protein